MSTGGVSVHVNGGRECACQRGACVSVLSTLWIVKLFCVIYDARCHVPFACFFVNSS